MKEYILVISDEVLEKTWKHPEDRPQELVRCKDCNRHLECDYWIENGDYWFCADGERAQEECKA